MYRQHADGTPSGGWSHFSGLTKIIVEANFEVECSPSNTNQERSMLQYIFEQFIRIIGTH